MYYQPYKNLILFIFFYTFRYYLQNHHETKDLILHSQPNNTLRWYYLLNSAGLLPSIGFWGESHFVCLHSAFSDCILPATSRDYPTYFACCAFAGKISALHHDIGHLVYMGYSLCVECAFPVSLKMLLVLFL